MKPEQEWHKLRKEILKRIDEIDGETPYVGVEPSWWIQMMEVRRLAQEQECKNCGI